MCITSKSATLASTAILSFKKENGNIFLSYSNRVINHVNGRNCMILPIPGTLNEEWFYDTTSYSGFMTYISSQTVVSEALNFGIRTKSISRRMTLGGNFAGAKTQVGMYEVHYSNHMVDLETLNVKLELGMSPELLDFFMTHYEKFAFICCLFDGQKEMAAQPISLEYKPINPDMLFYPSMDGHTGRKPGREFVEVDHRIIAPVKNKKIKTWPWTVPDFLNNLEWGTYLLESDYPNGDLYLDLTQDMSKPNLKRSYETII